MEKRFNEIAERKAAIMNELKDADEKKLSALNKEADDLEEESQMLRSKMDLTGKLGKPEPKIAMSEIEKRAKSLYEKGTMVIPSSETRSTVLGTDSLAKPTHVGGINDPFNTISSLVDMVYIEDLSGMGSYKEAYVKAWQVADIGTDGTAPNPAVDPTFRTVAINPFLIDTLSYVSRNLKKQTPLQYEEKVRKGALIALKKKVTSYIVSGNGSTAPFGIYKAANTEETPEAMIEEFEVASNTIDEKTLRSIVFAYGGDENVGVGARLFLNKLDLIKFGDVRGTNDKKAVYEIIPDGANPNTGILKDGGLSVPYVICSDVTALSTASQTSSVIHTMIYGAPGAYKLGLFGDYEIRVSEDYKFAEGLLSVKGEVMVGGNVIIDKGFVVVTLAAND